MGYLIMYDKKTNKILNVGQRPWANEKELETEYGKDNILVTENIEEKYPSSLGNYLICEIGKVDLKNKKIVINSSLKQIAENKIEVDRLIDEKKTELAKAELIKEGKLNVDGSLVKG